MTPEKGLLREDFISYLDEFFWCCRNGEGHNGKEHESAK
jgi:hypothetical protein